MKIVIPGGTGQVGVLLGRAFHADGHEVIVLGRNPSNAPWSTLEWDAESLGEWVASLNGADVVINMAGQNVNCRYTAANRKEIIASRVNSTRLIGEAINQVANPPKIWLQASTATIYSHRFDAPNDEYSGIIGGQETDAPKKWQYSIKVAQAWERTLDEAQVRNTRKIKLRSAMIMSPGRDGIFDTLLKLVRVGLGGRAGSGKQYVSWIHEIDFIRSINWLIENPDVEGVVNIASPNPLPYVEFISAIRTAWGIRLGLPATHWMLEIGSFFLRTETELVLKSRRVVPGKLLNKGFKFAYPNWSGAVNELVQRWRENQDQK
jgi:uncharacterized protein